MLFLKILFLGIVFCLYLVNSGVSEDFGYDDPEGPDHWGDKFPICSGKGQSPIDIENENVKLKKFSALVFEHFQDPLKEVTLENNGHTVSLKITKGEIPIVHGGPLKGKYRFAQLHFHWGPNDSVGSENRIDHQSYPLELHVVMYKTKYPDFNAALNYKDGLTVLSFLYLATDNDNIFYNQFTEGLHKVQDAAASTVITDFVSLDDFTTRSRSAYFTYEGSLTTPPCSEIVSWIVFTSTVSLSKEQLKAFRLISGSHGQLTHNIRTIQPINDRIIYMNSSDDCKSRVLIVILAWFLIK